MKFLYNNHLKAKKHYKYDFFYIRRPLRQGYFEESVEEQKPFDIINVGSTDFIINFFELDLKQDLNINFNPIIIYNYNLFFCFSLFFENFDKNILENYVKSL